MRFNHRDLSVINLLPSDSRQSIYSQESSRDGPTAKPSTPNHTDANNSQSSTDLNKSTPSVLKRKLLEIASPQRMDKSRTKTDSGSDDENRGDPDENANGIDLRIGHLVDKHSSKKR